MSSITSDPCSFFKHNTRQKPQEIRKGVIQIAGAIRDGFLEAAAFGKGLEGGEGWLAWGTGTGQQKAGEVAQPGPGSPAEKLFQCTSAQESQTCS